jgi:hypothetical protein
LSPLPIPRAALEADAQSPLLFDALIAEDASSCTFAMTPTLDTPGVREQRATARWPHHLPGEQVISLTGQTGGVLLRRRGYIDASWRGHGVRISEARFSAPVLLGECVFIRAELLRARRLRDSLHTRFAFRMWKLGDDGSEIETYRSQQDAIFFPGDVGTAA